MKTKSKILVIIGSILLLGTFIFPIWKIDIEAPQYPEGMGLYIWINKITGEGPNDLNTLNGLNHYIGMKTIDEESIPELVFMPYIIVTLTFLGLLVAYKGGSRSILTLIILIILLGVVGMYDFYMWEYDYGHNLNPDAPIKVPGMSYQPPFIGSKQLLNINATSLPWIGSAFIGMSVLLFGFSYLNERKNKGIQA
ncbi:MAG: hypothetical protein IPI12_13075 [Ignavibacteriales bacterium]|jgi:copper chaperone NosL|nr:hypothetical protein [Ignavibacteriales bacterium]MBP7543805.1 hypothetical protein [Ignavibacteriaceae bacterium]MBK7267234.1 hypothetical protein [Ignavibacteriales bacterium]MBK8663484.1 hypothetical protein [Ignavibacteriales bacterium]MBP9122794.1 hypothetical protein [Ignavibacteriaceae bacterium]